MPLLVLRHYQRGVFHNNGVYTFSIPQGRGHRHGYIPVLRVPRRRRQTLLPSRRIWTIWRTTSAWTAGVGCSTSPRGDETDQRSHHRGQAPRDAGRHHPRVRLLAQGQEYKARLRRQGISIAAITTAARSPGNGRQAPSRRTRLVKTGDRVSVRSAPPEMGQGFRTSLPRSALPRSA